MSKTETNTHIAKFGINEKVYCYLNRDIRQVVVQGMFITHSAVTYKVHSAIFGVLQIDEMGLYSTIKECVDTMKEAINNKK